jgi:hypothetical protein
MAAIVLSQIFAFKTSYRTIQSRSLYRERERNQAMEERVMLDHVFHGSTLCCLDAFDAYIALITTPGPAEPEPPYSPPRGLSPDSIPVVCAHQVKSEASRMSNQAL